MIDKGYHSHSSRLLDKTNNYFSTFSSNHFYGLFSVYCIQHVRITNKEVYWIPRGDFEWGLQELKKGLGYFWNNVRERSWSCRTDVIHTIGTAHCQGQKYDQPLTELKWALTLGRIVWGRGHEDTACMYYQ